MADLTYRSPKTEVRGSPIHGRGLFAAQAIARGEIVAVKGGHVLPRAEWAALEPTLGPAEIQLSEDLVIAPVRPDHRDGSMLFTNHSCDPNLAIQGQIVLVAMRDVAPGEELTIDWATTDDGDYALACRCASPRCRGTITGKDWMKPELQAKYRGWFCWFLQRKLDAQEGARHVAPARPEECDRLFGQHVNAGDLDALVRLYEPGGRLVRRDGSVVTGHAEIRLVMGRLLEMKPTFGIRVVKVVETGDDLALVYNDWTLAVARPDDTQIATSGKAIELVRRQPDGSWRFAVDDPFARG